MSTPYLVMDNVGKSYPSPNGGAASVLRDVSLEVRKGELVTLIGHSGCGKSTLVGIVAGLTPPTQGSVTLEGRQLKQPGPDRAMVFQNYSLLPWLTIAENIFQAVDSVRTDLLLPKKRALVDEMLETVGLAAHRNKRPGQVSGGMKQRAAIARAFATEPQVLLLDEPFGALDALTRSSLQEELIRLWSHEKATESVLMVTHDIDEAIYLSDRIVVMTPGPGATIGEVLTVDLPRPRDKRSMVHLPQYADVKERLLHLLMVEYAGEAPSSGPPR